MFLLIRSLKWLDFAHCICVCLGVLGWTLQSQNLYIFEEFAWKMSSLLVSTKGFILLVQMSNGRCTRGSRTLLTSNNPHLASHSPGRRSQFGNLLFQVVSYSLNCGDFLTLLMVGSPESPEWQCIHEEKRSLQLLFLNKYELLMPLIPLLF